MGEEEKSELRRTNMLQHGERPLYDKYSQMNEEEEEDPEWADITVDDIMKESEGTSKWGLTMA